MSDAPQQTLEFSEPPKARSLDGMVSRRSFEDWITAPPYERDTYRWPMDETKYAWPGQYKDIAVQLAWEAWCEASNVPDQATAKGKL